MPDAARRRTLIFYGIERNLGSLPRWTSLGLVGRASWNDCRPECPSYTARVPSHANCRGSLSLHPKIPLLFLDLIPCRRCTTGKEGINKNKKMKKGNERRKKRSDEWGERNWNPYLPPLSAPLSASPSSLLPGSPESRLNWTCEKHR